MQTQASPIAPLFWIVVFFAFIWLIGAFIESMKGRSLDRKAGEVLDGVFDGSPRARYTVTRRSSLGYDTVIDGATERGYVLVDKDDRRKSAVVLTFDRAGTPGRD